MFTMTQRSADFLRATHPWLRVLHDNNITAMIQTAGSRLSVAGNRIAKLQVSRLLLELNREIILTDVDAYWSTDPTEYLQGLTTPAGKPVEMAAMKDSCWLELNSGF